MSQNHLNLVLVFGFNYLLKLKVPDRKKQIMPTLMAPVGIKTAAKIPKMKSAKHKTNNTPAHFVKSY